MTRVHIICEGQTEETFVNELMKPHFLELDIDLRPSLIGKRGGKIQFQRLLIDIKNRLLGDRTSFCTTFFDFYALPTDFPGKIEASQKSLISDKANEVCIALLEAIKSKTGEQSVLRFIPYVQMYEFEGLLFSDPQGFCRGIDKSTLESAFTTIRDAFDTPEHINDNPNTAPSKRVENLVSDYEKPIMGTLAALEIGLTSIRRECLLFDAWLKKLEVLKAD